MRIRFFFFFFSFYFKYITSCILVLWPFWHILYLYSLHIDVCFSPTLSCVVSFLSLYTWFLYLVCNLIFLFHIKMFWWVLFKVFQKYRLSKSSCHKFSFCKVFHEFFFRIDFIVFNKWIWVEWFMTSLICSFVCCGFFMDCQRGRLLGHIWFTC